MLWMALLNCWRALVTISTVLHKICYRWTCEQRLGRHGHICESLSDHDQHARSLIQYWPWCKFQGSCQQQWQLCFQRICIESLCEYLYNLIWYPLTIFEGFAPAFQGYYRVSTKDKSIGNHPLKKGSRMFVDMRAANWSDVFTKPATFDPTRLFSPVIDGDGAIEYLGIPLTMELISQVFRAVYVYNNIRHAAGQSGKLTGFIALGSIDLLRHKTRAYLACFLLTMAVSVFCSKYRIDHDMNRACFQGLFSVSSCSHLVSRLYQAK